MTVPAVEREATPDGTESASWLEGLRDSVNPALERPRRAAGVEIFVAPEGGGYILRKLPVARYLRIEEEDLFVWNCLDGEESVLEIARRYLTRFGQMGLFRVEQLVDLTRQAGMLAGGPPDVVWAPLRLSVHRRTLAGRLNWINRTFIYRQIPLPGAPQLLARLHRRIGRLCFHPAVLLVALAAALTGFVTWVGIHHPRPSELTLGQLSVVGGLTIGSIVVHEIGHGLAMHRTGREVTKAGAFIMYGTPGGFVDTSDMWLATRGNRVAVTLAGPATNLVLGGVTAVIAAANGSILWAAFATGQYLLVLANLMPLLKLDGYYLLMDLTGVANLRERAMRFIPRSLPRKVRAAWAEGDLFPRFDRTESILLIYGVAAFGWMLFVGLVGLFLLPERLWHLGSVSATLGTRHWMGAVLAVVVVTIVALALLQLVAQRAKLVELGRVVQVRFDRSHGWGSTAVVASGCVVAGIMIPELIASRSSTSSHGWAQGLAALACLLGAIAAARGFVRTAGSALRLVLLGLSLACAVLVPPRVVGIAGATGDAAHDRLTMVGAVIAALALAVGRRSTISALLGDLRAGWSTVAVGVLVVLISVLLRTGWHYFGTLCIGLGTMAGTRLLTRPILARARLVDVPLHEPRGRQRSVAHLRRVFINFGERMLVEVGELFGPVERLAVLRAANEAAVDGEWRWWFVQNGTLVDRTEGDLTDVTAVYAASLERLVALVGSRCDPRVALDAIAEARAALPPRLGLLTDDWLGDALAHRGCARLGVDPNDESAAIRFALRQLSRVPITEVEQAVGRPALEQALGRFNVASAAAGWGIWFRANGRMLHDSTASDPLRPEQPDDRSVERAVLAMLYGQLVTITGRTFVRRAVRFAADGLPPELGHAGAALLTGTPWDEPTVPSRVRQRSVAHWPVVGDEPVRAR